MCTIMTIDREFWKQHREEVLEGIQFDATYNSDGWSLVLLGNTKHDTITMQSLKLSAVTALLDSQSWQRMFLHSRMATTTTKGIFGCHNFLSTGDGRAANADHGAWIIQHNGVLKHPAAKDFLVDSQYIAEVIRNQGLQRCIDYLVHEENYANTFLIDPVTGRYHVTRAVTNKLFSDGFGNFSTNPIAAIKLPVPERISYVFNVPFASFAMEGRNRLTPRDWETFMNSTDELDGHFELEDEDVLDIVLSDIAILGEEAIANQDDETRFRIVCDQLNFGRDRKIPNHIYSMLTHEQKGWFWRYKQEMSTF